MIRLIHLRKTNLLTILSLAYLVIIWVDTAAAQNCKPLLLSGKQTLFQRVISNPGANVYVSAKKTSPIVQASVKPLTIRTMQQLKHMILNWQRVCGTRFVPTM